MALVLKVSFALILCSAHIIFALTPWPQDHVITNESTWLDTRLNFTTRLPPVPKDFAIESYWDEQKSLNPLAVYVVAIRMMYGLSLQPWSRKVELVNSGLLAIVESGYNAVAFLTDTHDKTDLTVGLCVQALYSTINSMATREPGFYDSKTYITYKGEPIGRIVITNVDNLDPPTPLEAPRDHANATLVPSSSPLLNLPTARPKRTKPPSPTSTKLPVSFPTGSIPDPYDAHFTIDYTYTMPLHSLPAGDILSAALDGLATVSPYDHNRPLNFITALSVKRNVVWHVGLGSAKAELLLAGEISRTFFFLVKDLFLVERKFAEIWFDCRYKGVGYADGYVVKWDGGTDVMSE